MTETEWLAGDDPEVMILEVSFSPHKASERKLRLFACACCRLLRHNMVDPRSLEAVEVAERFVDDFASADELLDAGVEAAAAYHSERRTDRSAAELVEYLAALSADSVARTEDGWPFWEHARDIMRWAIEIGQNQTLGPNEVMTRAEVTEFLHDIFGNPFRPITFDPAWRTSDVMLLARGIYDERAFDRMPILADAIQDAGCDSNDILNHLRDPHATHVRGCWALDLVLGKE